MIYHKSKNCASRQDFRSFQSVAQRLAYREQESAVIEAWTCGRQARNYTHQPTKIAFWYFRTAMKEHIRRAVVVLRDSPALSDGQILRNLVESGMERVLAARFMVFLPMAYCRLILRASGARFSDTFRQVLPDGGISSERSLSSEPFGKPPWLLLAQRWNTACQEKTYWCWLHAALSSMLQITC